MSAAVLVQGRKELRALLPWWAAVAAATPLLAWATQPSFPGFRYQEQLLGLFAYALGVMAVAAVAVGHELSSGTLASLLVQPVSRTRVLLIKLVVLSVALAGAGAIGAWAFGGVPRFVVPRGAWRLIVWGPVAAGLGLVPLLTIVTGRALGGIVFGILIPGIVFALCSWFIPDTLDANNLPMVSPEVWRVTWLATLALSAAGLATLMWIFPRWQAARGGSSHAAAAPIADAGAPAAAVRRARPPHWVLLTIGKELRLQSMTLTISGFFVLGSLGAAVVRYFSPESPGPSFEAMAIIHAACVCLMAGALSSAEERQLGTWAAQVLSPRRFRNVWAVKTAVTVGLAITLAIGVPLLLARLDAGFRFDFDSEWIPAVALATVAAIYVSSFSMTGLSALIASMPAIGAAMVAASLVLRPILRSGERWLNGIAFDGRTRSGVAFARQLEDIVVLALVAAFAALLLTFASRNHRSAERRPRTMAMQAAGMLAAAVVAAVVYILARAAIWTLTR